VLSSRAGRSSAIDASLMHFRPIRPLLKKLCRLDPMCFDAYLNREVELCNNYFMNPVPLSKIQDTLDKLQPYMDQRTPIDQMTLRRLKKDVEQNMAIDPYLGSLALGNIAILEWDEIGVDKYYKNLLSLRNNSESQSYYGAALQMLGKFPEALEHARIASEICPTDLSLLRNVISFAINAGSFVLASELCEIYNRRSPEHPHPVENSIVAAVESIEYAEIDEKVIFECNKIAFALLREMKTPYHSTLLQSDSIEGSVIFFIKVAADLERVYEFDRELGERLFDRVPDFDPSRYWVGFSIEDSSDC